MSKINKVRYLDKKVAKLTIDFSAQRAIDSAYTFDAANVNATLDTITIVGHPYKTGDMVSPVLTVTTGVIGTVPAMSNAYWIIYVDQNTIALAGSLALAKVGTRLALTAGAAADVYLQRDCFGLVASDLVIPLGSVVTKVWYDVITTCKSWDGAWGAGNEDAATMSMGINSAVDVIAAISIADATADVWDAGEHATLIGTPILGVEASHDTALELIELDNASYIKTTADTQFNYTIAVDPISQGKIDVYVEYLPPSLAS